MIWRLEKNNDLIKNINKMLWWPKAVDLKQAKIQIYSVVYYSWLKQIQSGWFEFT